MSDIIYTPPATGGGGGQNPTANYIPLNNGTSSFVDSDLLNFSGELYTNYGGLAIGFDINFAGKVCYLGDYGNEYNNTLLATDFQNDTIYTQYLGSQRGLKLDFVNDLYQFGDYNSYNSGTSFYINVLNSTIYTQHSGQQEGLFFDFVNDYFQIGDFAGTNNGTYITIDDDNLSILSYGQGNPKGLKLDFANEIYYLGDFNNLANYTLLQLNDGTKSVFLGNIQADTSGFKYTYLGNGSSNFFQIESGCSPDGIGLYLQYSVNPNDDYLFLTSNYNLDIISFNNGYIQLNSYGTNTNSILLDPVSDKITFSTNNLNYVGTSLTDGATVIPVNKNLLVTINGTQYHIPLYN
jgi:hypothetical protein